MSAAQRSLDGSAHRLLERRVELVPRAHLDEQQHMLVFVLWLALAHTYHIADACGEHKSLKHTIDLARTKAHARWVQHAVAGTPQRMLGGKRVRVYLRLRVMCAGS
jgi:hypothetical protein